MVMLWESTNEGRETALISWFHFTSDCYTYENEYFYEHVSLLKAVISTADVAELFNIPEQYNCKHNVLADSIIVHLEQWLCITQLTKHFAVLDTCHKFESWWNTFISFLFILSNPFSLLL